MTTRNPGKFRLQLTPTRRRLIRDARTAGYCITEHTAHVSIVSPIRGRPGLDLWADGIATRNDFEVDLPITMYTVKQMREILGLNFGLKKPVGK